MPLRHPVSTSQCPPWASASSDRWYSGFPFSAPAQLGVGEHPGEAGVALRVAGQHHQVRRPPGRRTPFWGAVSPSDSSAPNTVGMPTSRAASAKRTTP